jgi:paraquat-inducible protein B
VPVGSVSNIELTFDRRTFTAYIPVTLVLLRDRVHRADSNEKIGVEELVRRGLRAQINIQSFVTGQAQVELNFASNVPAILHPGLSKLPEIPVQQSIMQKAQQTLAQLPLQQIADNTNKSLENISTLAEKLDDDLPPLIASVKDTSDQSRALVMTATKTLGTVQAEVTTTLSGINALAAAGTTQLDARSTDLHQLLVNTNTTVVQARQTLADLRALTSARSDQRADIDAALRDIAATAASLRGFASEVERNPQLLLMGRQP